MNTEVHINVTPGLWKPVFDSVLGHWVPAFGPWAHALLDFEEVER